MKKLGIFLVIVVLIIAGVGYYLVSNAGSLIKEVVEQTGPDYLGAKVSIDNVELSLAEGRCVISGLQVGNPSGFEGDYALRMDTISVSLDTDSLGEPVLVLNSVDISGASLHTIVKGGSNSNIKKLMENVENALGPQSESSSESDMKVIIDTLDFVGANARVNSDILGDADLEIPDLHIKDIGRDTNGATIGEVIQQLLSPLTKSVVGALGQKLDLDKLGTQLDEEKSRLKEKLGDKLKGLGNFGHPET